MYYSLTFCQIDLANPIWQIAKNRACACVIEKKVVLLQRKSYALYEKVTYSFVGITDNADGTT